MIIMIIIMIFWKKSKKKLGEGGGEGEWIKIASPTKTVLGDFRFLAFWCIPFWLQKGTKKCEKMKNFYFFEIYGL